MQQNLYWGNAIVDRYHEHHVDIHNEVAKQVSLHFNNSTNQGKGNISIAVLKSWSDDQINHQILECCVIYSMDVLSNTGINIQRIFL